MAKQTYSRREMLRLTGKLAVSVGAASIVVTGPACGGGGVGGQETLAGCDLVDSYTGPYYDGYGYPGGTVTVDTFYCDGYVPNANCLYAPDNYICFDVRYDL